MALRITLMPHEKILINGAVIQNGPRKTPLSILNLTDCLREADIMSADEATTPVSRLYYAIQMTIVDRAQRSEWEERANNYFLHLVKVFQSPDMIESLSKSAEFLADGNAYKALAKLRPVLAYEKVLFEKRGSGTEGEVAASG